MELMKFEKLFLWSCGISLALFAVYTFNLGPAATKAILVMMALCVLVLVWAAREPITYWWQEKMMRAPAGVVAIFVPVVLIGRFIQAAWVAVIADQGHVDAHPLRLTEGQLWLIVGLWIFLIFLYLWKERPRLPWGLK